MSTDSLDRFREPDGGTLRITTRNVPAPDDLPVEEFGLPDQREFVHLEVTDTGIGLDEEVRGRSGSPEPPREVGRSEVDLDSQAGLRVAAGLLASRVPYPARTPIRA